MTVGALTAFEHGEVPVQLERTADALSETEAARLSELARRLPQLCDRGHRVIRFGAFCGITSLGSRSLELLPKVDDRADPDQCRGILLGLLQRSRETTLFRQLQANQRLRSAPLLDVFIAAYFDEVSGLVRAGLLREYQTHDDDLRAVRGRVLLNRQFSALADRRDLVSCRYDELTSDNSWNRLLKAALRAVRPWIRDTSLGRRWGELMVAFEDVADVHGDAAGVLRLRVDRKAARYGQAAEWARRILDELSPSMRSGSHASPGLLFDINKLWEDAVAVELGRRLQAAGYEVRTQVTDLHLATLEDTGARVVGLRPDLIIVRNGRTCAVADTKWKRVALSRSGHLGVSREDVHQMVAYALAFRCERLALIYPWHSGIEGSRETTLRLPEMNGLSPRLSVVCVDPNDATFVLKRGGFQFPGLSVSVA